jgi:hypothetical protein
MLKNLRLFLLTIVMSGLTLISCNKDELKGCKSTTAACEVKMNGEKYIADIMDCTYNSQTSHLNFLSKDTSISSQILFSIYYPLQSLNTSLSQVDIYGKGTVTTIYQNVGFGVTHGNIELEFNSADSTICGEFFYFEKPTLDANQGWFSGIKVKRIN